MASQASTASSPPSTPPSAKAKDHQTDSGPPIPSLDTESALSPSPSPSLDTAYPPSRQLAQLHPPDGWRAGVFLLGAFSVEMVIWGIPSAYGVFLVHYQQEYRSSLLPWVGSLCSGGMYMLGPLVALALNPRPQWRVAAVRAGCVLIPVSLLASSFARTPWQLLLTQAILYSIGGSFVYYPTFSLLSEWFVARRGLANGVVFAGTAIGGLIIPFLLEFLLSRYGAPITLRALAVGTFLLLAVAVPLIGPRIPTGRSDAAATADRSAPIPTVAGRARSTVWRSKRWWIFILANTAQALGWFLPPLYLPTFAASLGLSPTVGSAMVACVNASSVVSRLGLGILSDRMSPHRLGALAMLASSASVLLLWGVAAPSLGALLSFALMLGLACGGWTSLYSAIIRDTAKDDPRLANTLFGLISLTRGVGSLLTAPLATFLINHPLAGASARTGFGVDRGDYGSMIVFAGVVLALAAGLEGAVAL